MIRATLALWRAKWNILRLCVAAFVLWVFATDTGARLARMQLSALPGFDYVQEVQSLRALGRYGEAVVIADAGLAELDGEARAHLAAEKDKTVSEQSGFLSKAKAVGLGALSGQGDSLEALIGAVGADLFVIGDVRDLVIQGGRQLLDNNGDEVLILLSVVGVVTTLAPEIDWVPSLLKAARKMGAISVKMGEFIKTAINTKKYAQLEKMMADVEKVAKRASPGGAARLLRYAEDPADIERIARFVEGAERGAFALHVTGREGAEMLKAGEVGEEVLIKAASKGRAGVNFLRSPAARALARPHWIVGITKSFWKGNASKIVSRTLERFDPGAWWFMPLLAGWIVVELGGLASKLLGGVPAPQAAPATSAPPAKRIARV